MAKRPMFFLEEGVGLGYLRLWRVAFGVDRIGLADACGLLVFVSFCLSLVSHSLGT